MHTVLNLLSESAKKYPDYKVLWDKTSGEWKGISLEQTEKLTDKLAIALLKHGFSSNEKFGILSEGRNNWVLSEYAILKIKAISVPLSVKLLPEEILFRMNHSEASGIFVSANYLENILKIYNQLQNKNFRIILLDAKNERIDNLLTQYKIEQDKVLFFDQLVSQDITKEDIENLEQIKSTVGEDDTMVVIYTSGTTGDPKGVMLTHKNFWYNSTYAYKHFRDFPQFCKSLVILPIDHSFAHTAQVYTAILIPYAIYFLDARGGGMQAIKNIPQNLQEVQPHFLLTVPALTGNFMKKIMESIRKQSSVVQKMFDLGIKAGTKINGNGYKKASMLKRIVWTLPYTIIDAIVFRKIRATFGNYKFSISGGAYLDPYQQNFFAALKMPIYQGYGLSENSPIISTNAPWMWKIGTTGHPMPIVDVKIMNNGQEMPKGEKGEIVVSGPCVMKGYYKNEAATRNALKDGWLYTGDIGYIDNDGFLVVSGREKALLISQDGEKYSPEEIEETIMSYSPFVNQIMLYNDHFRYTVAIITLDENYTKEFIRKNNIKSAEELYKAIDKSVFNFKKNRKLARKFPSRWLPSVYAIVPEPFSEQNKMLNSTMKMVRHRIVETYNDLLDKMQQDNAKHTITEYNKQVLTEKFFKK